MFNFDIHDFQLSWIVQPLILLAVTLIGIWIRHILDIIKDMRTEIIQERTRFNEYIAQERERFNEYVRNERCDLHRQLIEQHIKESENRISKMLQKCAGRFDDDLK